MKKIINGFTIVELIVVITVIGILASITVISYNGVQHRTQNENRAAQLQSWQSAFERYKAAKGEVPLASSADGTGYCLGTGFPNGWDGQPRCRDAWYNGATSLLQSNSTALLSALGSVTTNLPSGPYIPVNGTVGPYVYYWGGSTGNLQITGAFYGSSSSDCPTSTQYGWSDGNGLIICSVYVNK